MKRCLITGGTDGIGKETARRLAELDMATIIVGRNQEKGQDVVQELKRQTGNKNIEFKRADLSLGSEVRKLSQEITQQFSSLDILINNAGAFFNERILTAEGREMTLALNHLSYFLLTHYLLPLLQEAPAARIINVASRAHRGVDLDFANLSGEQRYAGWKAYQRSKLMNILFTYELARKLAEQKPDSGVTVNCLHPGFVASQFARNNQGFFTAVIKLAQNIFAIDVQRGSDTSVYLATTPEVAGVSGKYYSRCRAVASSPPSYRAETAQRLWEYSVQFLHH